MKEIKVKITFFEELLGTAAGDADIYRSYIASNAPDAATKEQEVEDLGIEGVIEKGMTVFPKDDGKPFLYDYQIKGFFKNSCGILRKVEGTKSSKIKAYKKEIDGLVFVKERKIPLILSGEIGVCQRPLRAQTAQGERVALSISESAPAGTAIEITIMTLSDGLMDAVKEWLDYGKLNGIGQWHNSGKGRFEWQEK